MNHLFLFHPVQMVDTYKIILQYEERQQGTKKWAPDETHYINRGCSVVSLLLKM